jgi:hypothetical protein
VASLPARDGGRRRSFEKRSRCHTNLESGSDSSWRTIYVIGVAVHPVNGFPRTGGYLWNLKVQDHARPWRLSAERAVDCAEALLFTPGDISHGICCHGFYDVRRATCDVRRATCDVRRATGDVRRATGDRDRPRGARQVRSRRGGRRGPAPRATRACAARLGRVPKRGVLERSRKNIRNEVPANRQNESGGSSTWARIRGLRINSRSIRSGCRPRQCSLCGSSASNNSQSVSSISTGLERRTDYWILESFRPNAGLFGCDVS